MDNRDNTEGGKQATMQLERHKLTINGHADSVGIIPTNAINPTQDEVIQHKKNKKHNPIDDLLHLSEIAVLAEYLRLLQEKIDAGTELVDAYRNGERDFDSARHVHLLEVTEWSKEDLLEGQGEDLLRGFETEYATGWKRLQHLNENSIKADAGKAGLDDKDSVLETSIETSVELRLEFTKASENPRAPEPSEPTVSIPAPGLSNSF